MDKKQQNALEYLSEKICNSENVPRTSGKKLTFSFNSADRDELETSIKILEHSYTFIGNEIEIIFQQINGFLFYYQERQFLNTYKELMECNFNETIIVIFDFDKKLLFKDKNEIFSDKKAIFFNYRAYHNLLNLFKGFESFVEYHNQESKEFIFTSATNELGVLQVGYNPLEERMKDLRSKDLNPFVEDLKKNFSQKEFKLFFKERIFDSVKNIDKKDRFFEIIYSLPTLIEIAEKDYAIFLRKFDVEKIKTRFKEERNKYFENLDKNLETVTKQLTTIPLSFSATVFASYQVKDKAGVFLVLIFISYTIYTYLALKVIALSKSNLDEIEKDISSERCEIEKKGVDLLKEFDDDFEKVKKKLKKIQVVISRLRTSFILLLILFLFFAVALYIINQKTIPVNNNLFKLTQ